MPGQIERRYVPATELRVVDEEGKKPSLRGHAAVFGQLSEELWGFREKIDPGTFLESIGKDDIRALFNHDPNHVLGRNKANTLTLREDDVGLMMENTPPDIEWARGLVETIKRGDVSQQSFSFITLDDAWETIDGDNVRTLKRVQLFDVGPVTFPAYPQTDVSARSLEALGVDQRKLMSAIVRAERHLPAQPEDHERMQEAARKLRELGTPAAPKGPSIDILRRRLDLAAVA